MKKENIMETRNLCDAHLPILFFSDAEKMKACNDDVIRVLLPKSPYYVHNLNFVTRFLDNNPPKEQTFNLHWSTGRVQSKAFYLDVFEIKTCYFSVETDEEHYVSYVIPVPVLFTMLGIPVPTVLTSCDEFSRDPWANSRDLAFERADIYNCILKEYCDYYGISFHPLDNLIKKDTKYMQRMRLSI